MTTFVLLAIDHDPSIAPEHWDWLTLLNHPDPVGLVAHRTVTDTDEGDLLVEQLQQAMNHPGPQRH